MDVWRISTSELVLASWGAKQPAGAFDSVVNSGAPRGPEGAKRPIKGLQPLIEQVRSADHLPVVNAPLVACAQRGGKVIGANLVE